MIEYGDKKWVENFQTSKFTLFQIIPNYTNFFFKNEM
jgi:hypothetical protein